ncbi:MAG: prephenate dehydrogenase [Acidobacteriales bacterium]|nr:prephenate dehydrogenase [Terriglobales bacterium]
MILKTMTIIGTGLIGGSLGLAVKQRRLAKKVVGCDRKQVLEKALQLGAIDVGDQHPESAIKDSDVVVLATPVGGIIEFIERSGPLLPPATLLTDVGSTKAEIMRRAAMVYGKSAAQRFLPGHPMAGKEHSGIEHADAGLFQGAVWIFTRASASRTPAQKQFAALVEAIGAKVLWMDAERHDRLCAWISHLPQMVSTAVANTLLEEFGSSAELRAIGGRALRELTRIAASPYSMWRDIAYTNAANIEKAMLRLEQQLAHIRENLKTPELRTEFERANLFETARKPRRRGEIE